VAPAGMDGLVPGSQGGGGDPGVEKEPCRDAVGHDLLYIGIFQADDLVAQADTVESEPSGQDSPDLHVGVGVVQESCLRLSRARLAPCCHEQSVMVPRERLALGVVPGAPEGADEMADEVHGQIPLLLVLAQDATGGALVGR